MNYTRPLRMHTTVYLAGYTGFREHKIKLRGKKQLMHSLLAHLYQSYSDLIVILGIDGAG